MSTKTAEHLIILGEMGNGILARLAHMCEMKIPAVLQDKEIEKYVKAVVRKFPQFPESLAKVVGQDAFHKRATEISTLLRNYYNTFLDILNFRDEAFKLLGTLSRELSELTIGFNTGLVERFMTLLTLVVKIHLLVVRVPNTRTLLACYARAIRLGSGNNERTWASVSDFVMSHEKNAVKELQDECAAFSILVGKALVQFLPIMGQFGDANLLIEQDALGLVSKGGDKITSVLREADHLKIMTAVQMREWVVYSLLVCPEAFENEGVYGLLSLTLSQDFVVQLYRKETVCAHTLFANLFSSFKVKKTQSGNKLKLSKNKNYLKTAKEAYQSTTDKHQRLRTYLAQALEEYSNFLHMVPGGAAPKLSAILCLLNLARNEVLWYFRHLHTHPVHKKKFRIPTDLPTVTRLIHFIFSVWDALMRGPVRKSISTYYLKAIIQCKNDVVHNSNALIQSGSLSGTVDNNLCAILDKLEKPTVKTNFEGIRMNWYRVSTGLSYKNSGVDRKAHMALATPMERVLRYSRCVDSLHVQLRQVATLGEMVFFADDLTHLMQSVLKGNNGSQAYCISVLRVLEHAVHNVHRMCPEEQSILGKQAAVMADKFLVMVVMCAQQLLNNINKKVFALRRETSTEAVGEWLLRRQQNEYQKRGLPGSESMEGNMRSIADLRQWKEALISLCSAVFNSKPLLVHNIQLMPTTYLAECVSQNIRRSLRAAVAENKSISPPVLLLRRFEDILDTFNIIEQNVGVGLSEIVRHALLCEFASNANGMAGQPIYKKTGGTSTAASKSPAMDYICDWYQKLFKRELHMHGIVYSPSQKAFITRRSDTSIDAFKYTDTNALKALCRVCGPYGVRALDKSLLAVVFKDVQIIQGVLKANQTTLMSIQDQHTDTNLWWECSKRLVDMDKLMKSSVRLGCVLQFRQLIREALGGCVRENLPFLYQTVRMVHQFVQQSSSLSMNRDMMMLDYLAKDCGISGVEGDHSLSIRLSKHYQNMTDTKLWALLPDLYGMCYISNMWNPPCKYDVNIGGHSNNLHCMINTVRDLMITFRRMPMALGVNTGSKDASTVVRGIREDFERFVKMSAYSILHLNNKGDFYQIPEMLAFLEAFILQSNGHVKLSILEECCPFTLIRTTFIKMYEKQTNSRTGGMSRPSVHEDNRPAQQEEKQPLEASSSTNTSE